MIKHLFIGVFLFFPIGAHSQSLPDLPPLKELPPIGSIEPTTTDHSSDDDSNQEYMIIDRRDNINGKYIDDNNNIQKLEGNDHLKYLDDQNSSDRKACIVINNILDCS